MIPTLVALTFTILALLFVCIVSNVRGDRLERELSRMTESRDYWRSEAACASAYNGELLQAVAKENQDKLLAKLRLQRLMARHWFMVVSTGAASLLVDDRWYTLTHKEKDRWRQRAQELLKDGADEQPIRDVFSPSPESEDEAA